jgi:alanine racemase
MDMTVVDLGDLAVGPGEAVTVFGPGTAGEPTVRDWARASGLLEHEVVTGLGPRLTRSVHGVPTLRSIR